MSTTDVVSAPAVVENEAAWCKHLAAVAALIVAVRVGLGVLIAQAAGYLIQPQTVLPQTAALVDNPGAGQVAGSFIQWDATHYLWVSVNGYPDQLSYAPWFPLYPMLARGFDVIPGVTPAWSLLIVSWLSLFFAVWGVMALARQLWPKAATTRVGLLLAWAPLSVFLLSGYPQALFVALVAWCFFFISRKQFLFAALVAAFASATRTEGIVLGGAVALAALLDRRYLTMVWAFVVSELGILAFGLYSRLHFGDFFAFFQAQELWSRERSLPFYPLWWSAGRLWHTAQGQPLGLTHHEFVAFVINDIAVLVALGITVWLIWKAVHDRRLIVFAVYSVISLISIVSSGTAGGLTPESMGRFVMCLVPLYLVAAVEGGTARRLVWTNLLMASAALAAVLQAYFNVGGWLT